MEENVIKCPFCQVNTSSEDYFCPNCGKKIREKPLSNSIGKQINIYLFSLLFPPLGLWPGIKYLKQKDSKLKKIGVIAIVLTILSFIITGIISVNLFGQLNQQLDQLRGSMLF